MPPPDPARPRRIAMWSGPRNISTAMMRAFENRPDTAVIDEPFYAAYLAATGADHPMRAEVLAAQPLDWRDIVRGLLGPVPGNRAIFYQKHMTHHLLPHIGRHWMDHHDHAFLIRAPADVLLSYSATRDSITLDDIGFRQQAEIFDAICDRTGTPPPVIDAADVLRDPGVALRALCQALGIPFHPAMLHWPAGTRATDGVWAPAWYRSVERSTGFAAPRPPANPADLHPSLRKVAEAAAPYYAHLARHKG
jgi:hypothetical protein